MSTLLSNVLNEGNVAVISKPMGWKTVYLMIDGSYYSFHHCNGHPLNDNISLILNKREICIYMLGKINIDIEGLLPLE